MCNILEKHQNPRQKEKKHPNDALCIKKVTVCFYRTKKTMSTYEKAIYLTLSIQRHVCVSVGKLE